MRAEEIKKEIEKLGVAEKLLLVEDLWDSIAVSNSEVTLSDWQKQELNRRYKSYQEGNMELHEWQAVHEKIKDSYS